MDVSPFHPPLAGEKQQRTYWRRLYGSSKALAIARASEQQQQPLLLITADNLSAVRLQYEIRFYIDASLRQHVRLFPGWETLPYDQFSPYQDIISERLSLLSTLPAAATGVLLVPVATLMHRLPPSSFIQANSLRLKTGDVLDREDYRRRLENCGYQYVSQVMEHGDFTVRGSLLDIYPMGSRTALRIDLLDDEIDSIRRFDTETQRSDETVDAIEMLPAREFPLTEESIKVFRANWRSRFEGKAMDCPVYNDVSQGIAPAGIEYYLPLFFEDSATEHLFSYLPAQATVVLDEGVEEAAEHFWADINERYEQARHDVEHPLLQPSEMFLQTAEVFQQCKQRPTIVLQGVTEDSRGTEFKTATPVSIPVDARAAEPLGLIRRFLSGWQTEHQGRVLFVAESSGRRETLLEMFRKHELRPKLFESWQAFVDASDEIGITVGNLDQGAQIFEPAIAVICESQLFGEKAMQRRLRKRTNRDTENMIRNLTELNVGAPVVHEEHGVGRYLGLVSMDVGDMENEFLQLEYAGGDKLYVPVASLQMISRYTGVDPEHAPLHKLGSGQWEKARRKAASRAVDVAAELLEIYARRAARKGHAHQLDEAAYEAFAQGFPFEETPDQEEAIHAVMEDMRSDAPMDRLVCGDVGFGKTEVAMRAAFLAVNNGKQVAMLVPTTLLSQQHYNNFKDRFADWPVCIEQISRFAGKKKQDEIIAGLQSGSVDIVIGTHKLLQDSIKFKRLGLLIIDEEHRFGVRQKERIKSMRSEVDILTLTATPIPRTLNMSLSGTRELSIIATPPAKRLSIRTFVREWKDSLLREALMREISRGGQVYFLHNDVDSIVKMQNQIQALLPEARVEHAHGQMREKELERVMLDFYHRRFNVLVCTTIIETGIDVPSANTIIINRADKFGLAQLYQLRGRVGRSHHRAYAYLIVPERRSLTADAKRRLEAIESLDQLGVGFTLATHDLEIRGAGEILGDEQSGQIQEIGFGMYMDLLERAVKALKAGKTPQLDRPLDHGAEIELHIPAILPEDYLPDVHARLIMYKRIASAADQHELRELQVEMIDRFGMLPEPARNLLAITELKLRAGEIGIRKIDLGEFGGRCQFVEKPDIDPMAIIKLIQTRPRNYKLEGNDKLKIMQDLPEAEDRFMELEQLFNLLTERDAA